jgi:hypothetical protein
MAHDIAERPAIGLQHLQPPSPFGGQVHDILQRGFRRRGQAVFQVLVPLAQDLQVQREDQRRYVRPLGPFDDVVGKFLIAHHIKLEPERLAGRLGDIFDRTDRHGGQGKGYAKGVGGAGGLDLAIRPLHPGQAHRGERHRHGHGETGHGRGLRPVGHVDSNALAEPYLVKITDVFAECLFGVTAGFAIVPEHFRHPAAVQFFQIVDAGNDGHGASPNRTAQG